MSGDKVSKTQHANVLGEIMQDNLLEETGKLGMHWVAHDRLIDQNMQKGLIHHGANRQSLYQYYHRNRR